MSDRFRISRNAWTTNARGLELRTEQLSMHPTYEEAMDAFERQLAAEGANATLVLSDAQRDRRLAIGKGRL